jgi:hypothetical protein
MRESALLNWSGCGQPLPLLKFLICRVVASQWEPGRATLAFKPVCMPLRAGPREEAIRRNNSSAFENGLALSMTANRRSPAAQVPATRSNVESEGVWQNTM